MDPQNLLVCVLKRPTVLNHKLCHGCLFIHVHLGANHQLRVALGQVTLLHQSLQLKVLLAGDDNDLVHVGDHDPGLEEQGQVHDDVLVAGGRALDRLPDHLLVDLGVGDPVQLLPLLLILKDDRPECGSIELPIVVEHTLTKLGSDSLPCLPARLHNPASHGICVYHRDSELAQHVRHCALPRCHTTRETD